MTRNQLEDLRTPLDTNAISMHRISTNDARASPNRGDDSDLDSTQVDLRETLSRPTRTYQVMLLLAGSMMIFHIIGINQVFGIFQVRRR